MYPNVSMFTVFAAALYVSLGSVDARRRPLVRRQLDPPAEGVATITAPSGAQVRYKEPGKSGVCETTPGVNSYSGYVDLDATTHMFFWFFEARHDPANAPFTLWLNGGPGSDSLIGLFQELGPCNISEDLTSELNPYAWNEISNMLFLSQPVGVGFSYDTEDVGSLNNITGLFQNDSVAPIDGRYSIIDPYTVDTTDLAAIGTWHILQAFLSALPQLDAKLGTETKKFHLWTESYGGHYGPVFFDYFYEQNRLIANGSTNGTQLQMETLGLINALVDEAIQAPYYPEFAVNNTYGIKAINDTVYEFMKFAHQTPGGCADLLQACADANRSSIDGRTTCAQADAICRNLVEGPYYSYGGRGVYDIRHPYDDPTPPDYFVAYLNQSHIAGAVGVDLNYTAYASKAVSIGFGDSGDFVYPTYIANLEKILNNGVRVAMIYGDADYICNWFGGEAVSLAVNYTHTEAFKAAGYEPFLVDGTEYGAVRQYGNFSFLRMYEAGHEVPYYQPLASLEAFRRVLGGLALADGREVVTGKYGTHGPANTTHAEPFVPLPNTTSTSVL